MFVLKSWDFVTFFSPSPQLHVRALLYSVPPFLLLLSLYASLCVVSPAPPPPPPPHLPTPPLSLIRCDQSLSKALKQRLLYIEMFTNINSSGKEIMCVYYFIIYSVITVQNMTAYVISSFTQWSQCKRLMHICYIIIYSVTAVQKINGYVLVYHLLCYHSAKD